MPCVKEWISAGIMMQQEQKKGKKDELYSDPKTCINNMSTTCAYEEDNSMPKDQPHGRIR